MGTAESSLSSNNISNSSDPRHHAASNSTAAASPRRPTRRARPVPVVVLNGLVLGLTGSGKRTLLQRLDGKDPFLVSNHNNVTTNDDDVPLEITVPYQPPANATVWDRIQLHVVTKPIHHVDFCVILINPRHDARNVRPYISKLLSKLIQQQQQQPQKQQKDRPPPCICFLLNFRDVQADRYPRIQSKNILEWTHDILQQHAIEDDDVMLQCISTSLKNCYGLSNLHYFIYKVYLRHKQLEFQQRLDQVQAQLERANEASNRTEMSYEAFLQVLQQQSQTSTTRAEGENDALSVSKKSSHDERVSPDAKDERQRSKTTNSKLTAASALTDSPQPMENRPKTNRSILPKKYTDPKQSLDDFFADDDEEEEDNIVTPLTSNHHRHGNKSVGVEKENSDKEDDDDDFFYDEGGHRHDHGGIVMDSSSSSDEDEDAASIESRESQIAQAREHSIIDDNSEESGIDDAEEAVGGVGLQSKVSLGEKVVDNGHVDEIDGNHHADNEVDRENDDMVKNGWEDDDDLGLGDVSDDYPSNPVTSGDASRAQQEEETSEKDTGEGWEGDDDIDLESDDETPVALKADIPVTGSDPTRIDDIQCDTQNDLNVDNDNPIARNGDTDGADAPTPASPSTIGTDTQDSQVEQTEVKTEESRSKLSQSTPPLPPKGDMDDSDDDFVVEDTQTSTSPPAHQDRSVSISSTPTVGDSPEATSTQPQEPVSSGISAAALAAIAAAEKEAQLMIENQTREDPTPRKMEKKKSKKKKNPEARKKKKKQKEKRRSDDGDE